MPNRQQHQSNGAAAGLIVSGLSNFIRQRTEMEKNPAQRFDYVSLAIEDATGFAGGRFGGQLPDVLEPATNPNHRATMHSYLALGLLIYSHVSVSATKKGEIFNSLKAKDPFLRGFVRGVATGYALHLLEDSGTTKGLPLV